MTKRGPGRPISENKKSVHVPNRMTREEARMLRLKAALYTGTNTSELIRQAVVAFDKEMTMPCMEAGCHSLMLLKTISEPIMLNIAGVHHEVLLHEMPIYECPNCGNKELDVKFAAEVEKVVDEEMGFMLNQRKDLPTELNFRELIII